MLIKPVFQVSPIVICVVEMQLESKIPLKDGEEGSLPGGGNRNEIQTRKRDSWITKGSQ